MGWWTDIRDTAEAVAVPVGNYFLPGSSLVTSKLVSDGAKQKLNSDFGNLAMLGSGVAGGLNGNMSNYSSLSDMFSGNNPATSVDYQNGADIGGAGSSPANTGSMTDTGMTGTTPSTTQPILPTTMSTGSNLPVDTTAGPINPAGSPNAGGAASLPDNIDVGGGYNPASGGGGPAANPGFLASLQAGNYGDALSAAGSKIASNPIPSIYAAGSLYDMYAKKQMAAKQEAMYNQNRADILNTYQPGSPEYNLLKQEMERKDAAAGRNSQYGTRANEFAANIAKFRTNALSNLASGQNTLANTALGNQYGMFNTPLTLAALTATSK